MERRYEVLLFFPSLDCIPGGQWGHHETHFKGDLTGDNGNVTLEFSFGTT
jgi:hypothetical protein